MPIAAHPIWRFLAAPQGNANQARWAYDVDRQRFGYFDTSPRVAPDTLPRQFPLLPLAEGDAAGSVPDLTALSLFNR